MIRPATGRALKILTRFPAFLRAEGPGKALGEIATALGGSLDEAERLATGIQSAHRLAVAEEDRDVLRLAALLGLQGSDFLILRKFYEQGIFHPAAEELAPQVREQRASRNYLEALKSSVGRVVAVMGEGCGTIWALLEGTAVLLNAATVVGAGRDRVAHPGAELPRGGFVHRTAIRYTVFEDHKPVAKDGALYLVENPIRDLTSDERERRQREWFPLHRGGFFSDPVAVRITGVGDRTVWPLIVSEARHEGFGFRGAVPAGKQLLFTPEGRAYLDGTEVTARCFYFRGMLAGDGSQGGTVSRFDRTAPKDVFIRVTESKDGGPLPPLILPLGDSKWRFSVREGAFDASEFEAAVFAFPQDAGEIQALPPSGKVRMEWRENEPFAATILIPAELKSLEKDILAGDDLRKFVRAGLERFRAAGIRLDVDYFDQTWILNKSVLRDANADSGAGVDFGGTLLPRPPEG
ncbi:MAG: hypothetical protein HY822_05745 [Acidobacteria bacterium]|nr:hypothetical protein [Acidobacteriota bacterium]